MSEKRDGRLSKAKSSRTPAQSFRLGTAYLDKLRLLADRREVSQAELLRMWIDEKWARMNAARKRAQQAQ